MFEARTTQFFVFPEPVFMHEATNITILQIPERCAKNSLNFQISRASCIPSENRSVCMFRHCIHYCSIFHVERNNRADRLIFEGNLFALFLRTLQELKILILRVAVISSTHRTFLGDEISITKIQCKYAIRFPSNFLSATHLSERDDLVVSRCHSQRSDRSRRNCIKLQEKEMNKNS